MTERTPPGATETTRDRLLEAAARLFAERGREAVSIRDIAAAAGVRHGNINYHFRSKDDLYREVLVRYCTPGGRERLHEDSKDLTPSQARTLFARIVREIVAEEAKLNPISSGLVRGELSRRDGVDDQMFERVVRPNHRAMCALIGKMFPDLGERERAIAALNVASQCIFLRLARPVALRLFDVEQYDEDLVNRLAERIITTSLHGLGVSSEDRK